MNKPAAFRATYSDLKLIKTRQCVQIVFELPLADFDAAYVILGGMPNPASETWFGIAPLKSPQAEKENETPKSPKSSPQPLHPPAAAKREKMDWRELQPAAQAGIRCADPVFRKFLYEMHSWDASNEDVAAEWLRSFCGVKSRAEFSTNHRARVLWKQLDDEFLAWKHVDA